MHVLVIGGTRFVGYLLAWRLLARGDRVTLLNRGTLPDPFGDRVTRVRADRTAPGALDALGGARFDACVDFAAYVEADVSSAIVALRERVGHYVFVSTGQVYLTREGCPRPAREEDYDGPVMARPSDPRDVADWQYGVGKRACEDALARAAVVEGFPATRLRIPMVNGERDPYRRIEGYLWRLLDGGPVLLPDGGTTPMRHVYGGAVARAIADLLGDERTFGRAFNLAQDETPTLAEVVTRLAALLGARARLAPVPTAAIEEAGLVPRDVSPFSSRWMSFLDPARARRELGFRHEPLDDVLGRIVASFLAHPPAAPPPGYLRRDLERTLGGRP